MIQKKICLLGTSGVGKTSLIRRFVDDTFSDNYLTSVGVAIKKKSVQVGDTEVSLTIWDLAGDDKFQPLEKNYLRGTSGYLMVADGTRSATLDHVLDLRTRHADALANVPSVLLLNKADLDSQWEIDEARMSALAAAGFTIIKTSAKEGTGVQEAFLQLAQGAKLLLHVAFPIAPPPYHFFTSAGSIIRVTAVTNSVHLECSFRSCLRPTGVSL